ncbi:alpha/beta hydrolase [Leuconostoc koreense]|nr:alpha/beta hydrolase [Leuconostoc mesenteroides]QGM25672.1 alpha/beta fold hydrolase [Leuconostoc mesenteroides subsp. mesenteroides]
MKMEFQGLTYEVIGEGIPIVFLHGLYLDRESTMSFFEPQVNFDGFKRIYIDLPGMGYSIATSSASADSIFDSLQNFIMNIIGQKKFILFGHSYGAYMTQALAYHFQDQVLSLFMTCPVIYADKNRRILGKHINISEEKIGTDKNSQYFDDFKKMNVVLNQRSWHDYQNLIIPGLQKANKNFLSQLQDNSYSLSFENELHHLSSKTAVCILVGRHDQVVGYEQQLKLIELSESTEGALVNKAGHNLMIDQPDLVLFTLKKC